MSNTRHKPAPGKGRAPAQWTFWEILLIIVSLLLIVVPLSIEVQQWAAPPGLPAHEALQQDRPTTEPSTDTPIGNPTNTPDSGPTNTPSGTGPTNTPVTPPTSTPSGEGVLSVTKNSSIAQGVQGQEFQFTVSVDYTGTNPQSVSLQDVINPYLELLNVAPSSGSCTPGQTVSCSFSVSQGAPVYVVLTVRIRPDAPHATTLSNRASANGVPSNLVSVAVVGDPIPPTPTPIPTDTPIIIPTDTPPPVPPTSTPVVIPPTQIPGQPTSTPIIPGPKQPTSTPVIEQPTPGVAPTRRSGGGGGESSRGSSDVEEQGETPPVPPPPPPLVVEPTTAPAPPAPPPPPSPPTRQPARPRQPQAAIQPTAVPVRATEIPPEPTEPPPTEVPTSSPTPPPPTPIDSGIAFRMLSDWGSAFPGQDVVYTIILQNDQKTTLRNVVIGSALPSNLTIKGAAASRGNDPTIAANEVRYSIAALAPGDMVQVTVQTTIKPTVASGTRMVAQSQLSYDGAPPSFLSNIVTVMVMENEERIAAAPIASPYPRAEQIARATAIATPTITTVPKTATPVAAPQGTHSITSTATPEVAMVAAAATVGATEITTGATTTTTTTTVLAIATGPTPTPTGIQANPATAPLPATSTGIPLAGGVLLGFTLIIRTVRLHRARERI